MKHKKSCLKTISITIVALTIITTAVYAVSNIKKDTLENESVTTSVYAENSTEETMEESQELESVTKVVYAVDNTNIIPELLLEKNQELKSIVTSLKARKQTPDEFHKSMANYATFIQIYQPTKTEQKYIAQLVTEGYELDKLIEIYKFWLDTDEDIELIKKIYDAYDPINEEEDNHWVEEVYNQITENKYGVLNREQIHAYYDKGLTRDDIITANRLCRLGKNTITEILDKKVSGTAWAEIIEENYSKSTKKQKQTQTKGKSRQKKQYTQIQNGTEILDAYFLAERTEKDINEYLDKLSNGDGITNEVEQYFSERTEGVRKTLKQQGLWEESQEIQEKNNKAKEYIKKKAEENGVTQEKISELIDQGYTELEILNASTITKKQKTDVQKVLKQKRAGQSWKDISQKEVQ